MKLKEFLQFFIGGFIGAIIYKFIVYFSGPYNPNWISSILEVITVAIVMVIVISLFRWWENKDQVE